MKRILGFGYLLEVVMALGMSVWLSGCAGMSSPEGEEGAVGVEGGSAASGGDVDLGFLLSMTYEEARELGRQHLDMSPYCRIVADEIVVLRQTSAGVPLKVRARGRVFLEMEAAEEMVALGQEAYVDRGYEAMVRGRPLLRRGNSMVEGLNDETVYYISGMRLQVMGKHRLLTRQEELPPPMMAANRGGGGVTGVPETVAVWNVMPNWKKSWQQGPNPLLPALSPEDIPEDMRAAPLLREVDEEEMQPRAPGQKVERSGEDGDGGRSLGRRYGEEQSLRQRRMR